jgi:isfu1 transposase
MKAYSQDLRDRVISLYNTGEFSKRAIAKLLKLAYQTVFEWIKRYKKTGDYKSKQHCQTGRKPRFSDKDSVLKFLADNPDSEGVDIRNALAPSLPMSTFYDTLHRMNITYKKRTKIQG